MPTNLAEFFNLLATPAFAAGVVLWLMNQVDMFAVLAPGPKRLVGIVLCVLISAGATAGLFFIKVIPAINADVLFMVFLKAFLIAQSLQLLTAPAEDPALASLKSTRGTEAVAKPRGFGWW